MTGPGRIEVDPSDHALIDVLRRRGRATLAEIGESIGLSPSAVKRRMDRLEQTGVITGYSAQINEYRLGGGLEAFTLLTFAGDTAVADIAGVATGMREVLTVFTTAGDPDALVHLRVRDVDHLTRAIDRLRGSGRVTGTKTLMVLDSWLPNSASLDSALRAR